MITRDKVLSRAADDCMKELYSLVYPKVDWNDFISQNKLYSNKYVTWEKTKDTDPNYIGRTITECIGPRPYEFYYLPADILKDVVNNYVHAYKIDSHQELLDIIAILKGYCDEPIVDKWIEGKNGNPGHKGYDHPDNIYKEIAKIITKYSIEEATENSDDVIEICNKFFKFLDMAGEFYTWNRDLNSFYQTVYLGCSPCTNKNTVIENWKKYRNKDIEINEKQIKEEYYGEGLD